MILVFIQTKSWLQFSLYSNFFDFRFGFGKVTWIKNQNVDIMDAGTASQYSNTQDKRDKLKWKKITDYTKEVHASYKSLRNINVSFDLYSSYIQMAWLGTLYSGSTSITWHILPSGIVALASAHSALGLRPVITK